MGGCGGLSLRHIKALIFSEKIRAFFVSGQSQYFPGLINIVFVTDTLRAHVTKCSDSCSEIRNRASNSVAGNAGANKYPWKRSEP